MFGFIKKIKLIAKLNKVVNKVKKYFTDDKSAKYKEIKSGLEKIKKAVPEIAEDIEAIKTIFKGV